MNKKFSIAMSLAVIVAILLTSLVLADNLNNDAVSSGLNTITVGNSTTITYHLVGNNSPQGDPNKCDATTENPVKVTITKDDDVSVSGLTSFSFTNCGPSNSVDITFSSDTPGSYPITHSISGGISGSKFNNNADFTLIVNPVTPTNHAPTLSLPADITEEATSADGAVVMFDVTGSDEEDGELFPSCTPASGSTFELGVTQVDCSVTDSDDATTTGMFNVMVVDTTPPDVTVPANITAEATGPSGAAVSFSVSASDLVDSAITPTCNYASGSAFALDTTTTVTCTATDAAGKTGSASFTITVVDTTPPDVTVPADITAEATGPSGAAVSFSVSASDLVDGVIMPTCNYVSDSTFALGTTLVTCSANDAHSNTGNSSFTVTVVDTIPPTITYVTRSPVANSYGWNNTDVTVKWSCSDLVGVKSPSVSQTVSSEGENQSVTGTCEDTSGNKASDTQTGINIDKTAPVITFDSRTAANANGWNNGDVTITWSCTDSGSGIVDPTVNKTVSTEGENQSAAGTCEDLAGNTASNTQTGINIDKTAPTLNITGTVSGASNICSALPSRPTFAPTDDRSGISASNDTWTVPSTPSGVGTYTYSATATDKAGNSTSETRTYNVNYGAAFSGYLQPINADGSSRFKLGSTVPVKFQLKCGTTSIANATAWMYVAKGDNVPDPGVDEATSTAASTTGNLFRYDSTAQQYIFNLSTKLGYTNPGGTTPISFAIGSWTLKIKLDDGNWYSVNVQLPK